MRYWSLLILFASTLTAFAAGVPFPGKQACVSPDGTWEVFDSTARNVETRSISLAPAGARHTSRRLWRFDRTCEVLWSPDSQRIAITDWETSSSAKIEIVRIGAAMKATPLDLSGIKPLLTRQEMEGHCYYEAVEWEDATHLRVQVSGHTDAPPAVAFEHRFSVDIATGQAKPLPKQQAPATQGK